MSQDSGIGSREHFQITLASGTPTYLGGGSRDAIYIYNEGGPNIRIGNPSGTLATQGTLLPSGTGILDSFSDDPWWAFSTATCIVSGFIVRSG